MVTLPRIGEPLVTSIIHSNQMEPVITWQTPVAPLLKNTPRRLSRSEKSVQVLTVAFKTHSLWPV